MLPTILISGVILLMVAGVFVKLIRDKMKGKSSCGCGCESCASSAMCHPKSKEKSVKK